MTGPLSRLLADLIGASVGLWGIWNLLRKQHRLLGAARVLRWTAIAAGLGAFTAYQRGMLGRHSILGVVGLLTGCFFFGFPDISFYLALGCQRVTGWPRGPQCASPDDSRSV